MALMLEKGENTENNEDLQNRRVQTTIAGEFDGLRRTRRAKPITIQNRFGAFIDDNDSGDDIDADHSTTTTRHKPNRRQRQRKKVKMINALLDHTTTQPQLPPQRGKVQGAVDVEESAASDSMNETEWIELDNNSHAELQTLAQPTANRHSTSYMIHLRMKIKYEYNKQSHSHMLLLCLTNSYS